MAASPTIRTLDTVGTCVLQEWSLHGCAEYRMNGGKFGSHTLSIEHTDGDRLETHWRGYLAANGLKFEPKS